MLKNTLKNAAKVSVLTVVSSSAFADGSAVTTKINEAVSQGQSNYTLVVVGILSMAAIGFGLYMIKGTMRS
ncbi:hypothetical protein [Vibrio campbellii]|uniref:hypothetical protein n=1 Tax=Vibrio campbellii TaxID=680 RepID=UPI0002AE201B|nr:hypothetical protein [Vibrio campbellii]ARV74450.1 hypothetical protein A8140_17505 [Vibrio campbellii CAIM 519 = NBRC 15631 = ATCC 25920]ELU52287.1 hypothetical protein B878_08785 [Vibrio campbellii CAIM 519 = NBRC 15631 = ATCC 25920]